MEPGRLVWIIIAVELYQAGDNSGLYLGIGGRRERSGWTLNSF